MKDRPLLQWQCYYCVVTSRSEIEDPFTTKSIDICRILVNRRGVVLRLSTERVKLEHKPEHNLYFQNVTSLVYFSILKCWLTIIALVLADNVLFRILKKFETCS